MNFYGRIAHSIDFYTRKGFKWIDTPWIVPDNIRNVTFKGDREKCALGNLVGSAEQGFIQLMLNGLPNGDYVSAGPCFRFDDAGHPHHYPYFFKVELCRVGSLEYGELLDIAEKYLGGNRVMTPEGFDLEINGLEIGSYGSRLHESIMWSYGTGLAEPRYSEALEFT